MDEIDLDIPSLARRVRCLYDEFGIVPASKNGRKYLKEYLDGQGRELPDELK